MFKSLRTKIVLASLALMFSTACFAQDEGVLYRISLDDGSNSFALYDIATDSWTDLTPFPSGAQLATSADGRLFGWNTTANEIQEYNPVADSWSFIQAAPPITSTRGNLEFRSNGEWVYSQFNSSTLYYTVAGAWQTLGLPFQANAIGDYDPVSDTLVIGQSNTNYFHAIDMGTLAITPFTTDTSSQGELARCGQIRNGRFYYQTASFPLRFLNLADNSAAPIDVAPLYGFYDSCAVSETEEVLFGGSLNGSLLSSVALTDSTKTTLASHTAFGNHSSITWVGTQDVQISDTARFHVTKTFVDGQTDSVDVSLTCNGGLPLEQDFTIKGGGPGVTFVVTNVPEAGATCEVTESGGPDGYTPVLNGGAGCEWTGVTGGVYTCEIVNAADPGMFTVTKTWEVSEEGAGDEIIQAAEVAIFCDQEIIGGEIGGDGEFPLVIQLWVLDGIIPGNGFLTAYVDTSNGPANCTAVERSQLEPDFGQSGIEVSNDCPPLVEDDELTDPSTWLEVTAGGSAECTITNTVFFEGIPSLNQYGLAIMALLMLGMGMVGFRRIA